MVPHNKPTLGVEEECAAARVLASGWVAQGAEVAAFENELCGYLGLPEGHAVAVSSGSSALYLALWALNGLGRRVGLPAYACTALRNAVGMIGGQPIYFDCAVDSPNVDLDVAVKTDIDILIAPSMYGIPVESTAGRCYKLIEDLAQSLGAAIGGVKLGNFGEVGICSFYATKLMTSGGQGGAVISRDKTLIDAVRDYRQFDCRDDSKLRFNFQMTDLQAAIGRVQLEKLPDFLIKREELFNIYRSAGLPLLDTNKSDYQPVRYRAVLQCDKPAGIIDSLLSRQIRAIVPIEDWELPVDPSFYPSASNLTESTLSLPIYPTLAAKDAERIARFVGGML